MRELLVVEAANNRNFVYIYIHHILHRMGFQANNLAKEAALRWPRSCRQTSLADYDVTGPGDGDWF